MQLIYTNVYICFMAYLLYAMLYIGIDALGEVTVRLQDTASGRAVFGRSSNTDVIVASAEAYVHAVNRLLSMKDMQVPLHPQLTI